MTTNDAPNDMNNAEAVAWAIVFDAGAASRDAEILQLQKLADEVPAARKVNAEHDRLLVEIAAKDAEIAELVAALEQCDRYAKATLPTGYLALFTGQVLAKVRKP